MAVAAAAFAASEATADQVVVDGGATPSVSGPGVEGMLEVLVGHLASVRDRHRHWELRSTPSGAAAQPTGRTALVSLSMVLAGVSSQDPRLEPAIEWLTETPATGTYAIAVRLMLWCRLPPRFRPHAMEERRRLLERFSTSPPGWDYRSPPRPHMVDHSLTQFAFQAVADSEASLGPIPGQILEGVRTGFAGSRNIDGGWTYRPTGVGTEKSRGSMTAAALATLALAEESAPSRGVALRRVRSAMASAIDWLDRHFDGGSHPGHATHTYYWMHALERASRATGLRRFGGQAWFPAFAETIRRRLFAATRDGGWRVRRNLKVENLAFAVMVLRRGLEPLVFASFDPDGVDVMPSRLGKVAASVGEKLERRVGWTRIDLRDSTRVWSDFAVLFLHGRGSPSWLRNPESETCLRLRAYLESGGSIVVATADRGEFSRRFAEAVRSWYPRLLCEAFRPSHPVRRRCPRWAGRAELVRSALRPWVLAPDRLVFARPGRRPCSTTDLLATWCVDRAGPGAVDRADLASPDRRDEIGIVCIGSEGWRSIEPGIPRRAARILAAAASRLERKIDGVRWIDAEDVAGIDLLAASETDAGRRSRLVVACMSGEAATAVADRLGGFGWTITAAPPSRGAVLAIATGPGGSVALLAGPDLLRAMLRPSTELASEIAGFIDLLVRLDDGPIR